MLLDVIPKTGTRLRKEEEKRTIKQTYWRNSIPRYNPSLIHIINSMPIIDESKSNKLAETKIEI
jgi:hypothetical protein